jgi:aminopeptidase N
VLLDDGLADPQLLTLLRHDTDAFNRWEASQRLGLKRILRAVRGGQALQLDHAYVEAMRALLRDPQLDAAFKAQALSLPDAAYIAEQLETVDPQAIHAAVEAAWDQLARELRDDWMVAFEANQVSGGYRPTALDAGKRALANLALALLVRGSVAEGDAVWPGKAYQRVKDASNMTERFGALAALVNAHAPLAEPALAHFHQLFADDALVIDKWFALQARAPEKNGRAFERAKKLLQHPGFTLKNPNRARSLLVQLCNLNPGAFHRPDAAGYVLWADQVAALDAINPQLAARLARAMDRWAVLAEPFRSAAQVAIKRLAERATLSNDVREIATKALESAQ